MRHGYTCTLVAGVFLMMAVPALAEQPASAPPSIRILDWLVGTWRFEDSSTPEAGFDAREEGIRSCAYVLDGSYIHCHSRGASNGRTRTYSFYFGYDPVDAKFEMVAMHGNWSRTLLYEVEISNGGRTLRLLSMPYVEQGRQRRSWSEISYDGSSAYIWETGSYFEGETRGAVKFRDRGTRLGAFGASTP